MKQILLLLTLIILTTAIADAATLTCTQFSEASLSIPQFSSKTIEIHCTASGGTVSNIQITPNPSPGTGLTITSSQTISSSIADLASSTAKWSAYGDSPNTYSVSYSITSDGTKTWSGADTTSATVSGVAKLTVDYVDAPENYTSGDTLDVSITNIGGTVANTVKLQLNSHDKVDYPTSIDAGASASYSWTGSAGYNGARTYVTKVFIGDVQQDSASVQISQGHVATTTSSSTTSSTTTTVRTTTSAASAGGGGGAIGLPTTTATTIVTTNTMNIPEQTFTLGGSQSVGFNIKGSQHSAKVTAITATQVTLEIASTPFTVTLEIGETKPVDSDGNGLNDLEIKLNSINLVAGAYKADLSFKILNEVGTPNPTTGQPTTIVVGAGQHESTELGQKGNQPPVSKPPVSPSSIFPYLMVALAVVAIGIVIMALVRAKKRRL